MLSKKFLLFLLILLGFLLIAVLVSVNRFSPREAPTYAPDYSWVIGQLEYNPIEGGFWQIRFADQSAQYGGKFVLGNDPRLANFKNGDLVKITGRISEEQVSFYQAGTLYNLESIDLYQ